jgi:hypothetical protein
VSLAYRYLRLHKRIASGEGSLIRQGLSKDLFDSHVTDRGSSGGELLCNRAQRDAFRPKHSHPRNRRLLLGDRDELAAVTKAEAERRDAAQVSPARPLIPFDLGDSLARPVALSSQVILAGANSDRTAAGAVSALARALKDKEEVVRRNAARALSEIGPAAADAVPALTKALKDDVVALRRSASNALKTIGQKS